MLTHGPNHVRTELDAWSQVSPLDLGDGLISLPAKQSVDACHSESRTRFQAIIYAHNLRLSRPRVLGLTLSIRT